MTCKCTEFRLPALGAELEPRTRRGPSATSRRFEGRTAVVTGAAQGLGYAVASRFAHEGASVVLCDVEDADLQAACDVIAACAGGDVSMRTADVTDLASVEQAMASVAAHSGGIDVLVCSAGIIRDARLEQMTTEQWRSVIDVNLTGAFHCTRAVLPAMLRQGYGRLLYLSSIAWRGNFGQANYAASKAGLVGFARTVALEGARAGVTSNVICPGPIQTPMLASIDARAINRLAAKVPQGRIGHPGDIAEAAAYLCSEAAGFVTGVVLDVDGGSAIGFGPL